MKWLAYIKKEYKYNYIFSRKMRSGLLHSEEENIKVVFFLYIALIILQPTS